MNVVLTLYKNTRTVFRLIDVAMLVEETRLQTLSKKLNYYVSKGQLRNPRKGIYTKPEFNPEELACRIYTPCYISLDYVLQKAGIIFQFDTQITAISYLSRTIEVENQSYRYRKIKGNLLSNTMGIRRLANHINIALTERAFLDMLYLEPDYYFDNFNPLDKTLLNELLPIYQSKALTQRVTKLLQYGRH
ncbi:MAG: hypothetical protein H8E51_10400 [Bacteroidetes bacterium]|nr:hypothetical protein [Bacteroidota bacterium]